MRKELSAVEIEPEVLERVKLMLDIETIPDYIMVDLKRVALALSGIGKHINDDVTIATIIAPYVNT